MDKNINKKWLKLKIITSNKGIDPVSEILDELGFSALEIEDNEEFVEIFEKNKSQWQWLLIDEALYEEKIKACSVAIYIAANQNAKKTCDIIADKIGKLKESDKSKIYGPLEILTTELDEEDWAENWKKYFKPLPVGKNILICPVWEAVPLEYKDRVIFKIDPGMSFGTGTHETTRLCIESLEKYFAAGNDNIVLDLGCGSGILSIISLLLGAKAAYAVDIDENCVPISKNNASINGVDLKNYSVYAGNILSDKNLIAELSQNKYDIILINIVPDVIIPLLPVAKNLVAPNGKIMLSGIIERYAPDVEKAIAANNLKIVDTISENDWVCITVAN